jgi:hypothetical protein
MRRQYGDLAPKSALYGIWDVAEFRLDGVERPPLVTDAVRWRRVAFDSSTVATIQPMNENLRRFLVKTDEAARTLTFTRRAEPTPPWKLSYTQPAPDELTLEGVFDGRKVVARLRRLDPKSFLLLGRGFHWINEFPYNR